MKRFAKWLFLWITEMSIEEKIGFSIGGISGITMSIIAFVYLLSTGYFWLESLIVALAIFLLLYGCITFMVIFMLFIIIAIVDIIKLKIQSK